mmetsp:Transcript_10262/g.31374  ORF Transcript_10262/g.31374 Transcript_10262/m.31374 type:complete len:227 (-) Transcript_10262:370-1050(-)
MCLIWGNDGLEDTRIVPTTLTTLVVGKVEVHVCSRLTIVAEDLLSQRGKFFGHLLQSDDLVHVPVVLRNVRDALETERAPKVLLCVLFVAVRVHGVAAVQEHARLRGGEEVLAADRTVHLQAVFETLVVLLGAQVYARIALVAVEDIDARTFSHPADAAAIAVVDVLSGVVIVQPAMTAKVPCKLYPAAAAPLRHRLHLLTLLAHHSVDGKPVDEMVAGLVVTEAT